MGKTAIVLGATGLVGGHTTRRLLADPRYDRVRVFVRRPTGLAGTERLDERIVDFDDLAGWLPELRGDELFCALGTTLRQAGSKAAQQRIDRDLPLACAQAAAAQGVARLLLVSSAGADPKARSFYLRIKGELDAAVQALPFDRTVILRPSLLLGARATPRPGERLAEWALAAGTWLPGLRRYRAIPGATVAAALIAGANLDTRERVLVRALDQVFALAATELDAR